MTLEFVRAKAQAEANKTGVAIAIVEEGIHADEHAAQPSYGFCPEDAVQVLYPFGRRIDSVVPNN